MFAALVHVPAIPLLARALSLGVLAASSLAGQTLTVDLALDDFADFGGAQTVADLPGPDGHITLREAVTAANNTPGPQTIAFAIPHSEWSIFSTQRPVIRLEMMLFVSDADTTLDFSTQADFTGQTNPGGGEVGLQYAGPPASIPCLWLAAERCTVRGLDATFGNNFDSSLWITGNHNLVVGCTTTGLLIRGDYGGGDFNVIGGSNEGEGNTFGGACDILSGASDNVVVGNTFTWGLRISGDTFNGTCDRNRIGGPSVGERNVLSGHGYYAEEGLPSGTQLEVFHAKGTLVQGNHVGTTRDGLSKYPGRSGSGGIAVGIGAVSTSVRDNLVSGIAMTGINHYAGQRFGTAIAVVASARDTLLVGNRIGVSADGSTPLPNVAGIVVQSDPNGIPGNVQVGGTAPGEANLVATNEAVGVQVGGSSYGVQVRGNSIHDNGALGIDLLGSGGAGVTPNDALDADSFGGNHLQNFPVLVAALRTSHATLVLGRLESEPLQAFTLDFYASTKLDPSGFGEGALFLGSATLTTGADGRASVLAHLPNLAPLGWFVSATATQLARGETSEFSAGQVLRPMFWRSQLN